jgi:hypothetical protein
MRQIFAIGILLLLTACDSSPKPVDLSTAGVGVLAGCPILPGANTVTVTQSDGVDFHFCKYTDKKTGRLLFTVYVGEHPEDPSLGLRYAGATRENGKDFVWFTTPSGGWGKPRTWYTFIPTGSPRGTVMVVTFTSRTPDEQEALFSLAGRLKPSL